MHRGANTLTPGDTCSNYATDNQEGHDKGYIKLAEWQATFSKPISERLANDAVGVSFSPLDVYGMMELCGFEILARGGSPWCDVFSRQEWLEFEYARDLLHYYRAGPGNKFGALMGWLWLNATQHLMSNHSSKDVYFSFVHDGDIIPAVATLGILSELSGLEELPTDRVAHERNWRTSDVVPMGGRLVFERITCEPEERAQENQHAVRLFVNDALVDLTSIPHAVLSTDIEGAISLESFQTFLSVRGSELGDFRQICGLASDAPDKIEFLHQ
jgi:acid phosphatase